MVVKSLISVTSKGLQSFKQTLKTFRVTRNVEATKNGLKLPKQTSFANSVNQKSLENISLLKPVFQSFRSSVPGNALRIMQNMRSSNGISRSNFFFNDYMAKRARFGTYLFSFGGLVMLQDELYEERDLHNSNVDSLNSFCHSLKDQFDNSFSDEFADNGQQISKFHQFTVGSLLSKKENSSLYDFVPKEDSLLHETLEESFDFDSKSFEIIPAENSQENNIVIKEPEYVIEVVEHFNNLPPLPLSNEACIDAQLMCQSYTDEPSVLKILRQRVNSHPNIKMIDSFYFSQNDQKKNNLIATMRKRSNFVFNFGQMDDRSNLNLIYQKSEQSLFDFLNEYKLDIDTIIIITAQMLEAVSFLQSNFTVHRSISPHSVYIDTSKETPRILLGDFLQAFKVNSSNEMKVPFSSMQIDTRNNFHLWQAPEVFSAKAGNKKYVNYQNSDTWSVGMIALQMFQSNIKKEWRDLDASEKFFKHFIVHLLDTNPIKRMNASLAADILHLHLFATSSRTTNHTDDLDSINKWLTNHVADFIMRRNRADSDQVFSEMCSNFFKRLDYKRLVRAYDLFEHFSVDL